MLLQNHLFLIPVGHGIIFILAGWIMLKFPPKNRNSLYGYRTTNSMKSPEDWDFAQVYAAKEMIELACLLVVSGGLGLVYQPNETLASILGIGLMLLMVVVLIIRVESAIKKKFKTE